MNATHLLFILLLPACLVAQADPEEAERIALESAFEELMSGCKMTGQFTEIDSNKAPQQDSYKIAKIKKLRDEKWQFDATIKYHCKSVTLPLAVDVYWAGDTPTIQVTDLNVPTLGRFNARIVIYDNQYAGMWSGKDHGGHMFGKIEPEAVPDKVALPERHRRSHRQPTNRVERREEHQVEDGTARARQLDADRLARSHVSDDCDPNRGSRRVREGARRGRA